MLLHKCDRELGMSLRCLPPTKLLVHTLASHQLDVVVHACDLYMKEKEKTSPTLVPRGKIQRCTHTSLMCAKAKQHHFPWASNSISLVYILEKRACTWTKGHRHTIYRSQMLTTNWYLLTVEWQKQVRNIHLCNTKESENKLVKDACNLINLSLKEARFKRIQTIWSHLHNVS